MRRYETIIIVDPDLGDEERVPLFTKIKELIPQEGGELVMFDEWGQKKLAYDIKKKPRGYYVRIDYCGTGPLVNEMERSFRIDDRVLKYMTVLIDENVDMERIKEEIAKSEAAEESSEEPLEEPFTEKEEAEYQVGENPTDALKTEEEKNVSSQTEINEEE
ncbi:MAG: 30S ribosomal protein S6 [Desulfobacterales bacterium]|nr:30S ribosomal protein S6 [Desulfobacterales bacterium]